VEPLLDAAGVGQDDLPALLFPDGSVLKNPEPPAVARRLGRSLSAAYDVYDLVIVGAGPAGLAAAVYGGSEGLRTLLLDRHGPGGQAGTSSRIENYLGFPAGISGQELAERAHNQALRFRAQFRIATRAARIDCSREPYTIEHDDGQRVSARCVIVATGAEYRRLPLEGLERFEGAGVYYAATPMEAQLCSGEDVVVVGGGNSAGQAAMFLASRTRRVHILIRSAGLSKTMSRYLIRRIEEHPDIVCYPFTELVALSGNGRLEGLTWRSNRTGETTERAIRHVFSMTGAVPGTGWLAGCLALDANGFVKTGADLTPEELAAARWPLARAPYLLETDHPRIFAVGDVRAGSLKRVASAVGEGSVAVAAVHHVLAQ
jgi:thioredoxin reductase (NADPH)